MVLSDLLSGDPHKMIINGSLTKERQALTILSSLVCWSRLWHCQLFLDCYLFLRNLELLLVIVDDSLKVTSGNVELSLDAHLLEQLE